MSYPFIIWTMQRTGGTSLTELLMKMSEHKSADHEPFNWRRHKPRQFGHIAQNWVETKNDVAFESALAEIFSERFLIKHCYELHGTPFNSRIMRAAAKTDYRHLLLLRRDELSRLVSKFIAEAHGTWFKDYAAKVYAKVSTQERTIQPLPVEGIVRHYTHCQTLTAQIRELMGQLNVETREIYYEDIYLGDPNIRLGRLNQLFDFIGFAPEVIEAHRADIEEKIFHSGQRTADILEFVPNLAEVRKALALAGYRDEGLPPNEPRDMAPLRPNVGEAGRSECQVENGDPTPQSVEEGLSVSIFTPEKGFASGNGLGYGDKELNRLNARYRAFIVPNAEKIQGRRVLDLGSHDGRWTLAALMNGAAHVTGVETRQQHIDKAQIIATKEIRDRARFIQGDIFDVLPRLLTAGERFDVVLCLGIFYLVMDHHRLLQLMTAFQPKLLIIDTNLIDSDDPFIKLKSDAADGSTSALAAQKPAVVGVVSRGGMSLLAAKFGYKLRYENWENTVTNREGLQDYFATNKLGVRRYTFYLERA